MTTRSVRHRVGHRLGLAIVLLAAFAGLAAARPGGGDSFSGGGGHGSSSSGDSSGVIFELIYWTFRLCFYYPQIGVPVLGLIIVALIVSSYRQHQNKDWDSGPPAVLEQAIQLDELRAADPDFSQIVFEDFAFRLFSTAQRARSSPAALEKVAPYVSLAARNALAAREPAGVPVEQVIVGALRAVSASTSEERTRVTLEFEANVLTAQHTYYSVETWMLSRAVGQHSKPPGAARDFPCPNCGAPWQASATGTQQCASCGQVVDNGRFDWIVNTISLASIDERSPSLTTEVPERGTSLPTYFQDGLAANLAALSADDPTVDAQSLRARLELIYTTLNAAWANNALAPVRGFVSDGLYDYLQYWVDAYKRQGLRNQLTDMRILETEIAKVVRDRWYDAVTIRVWGTGKDFVVRGETGEVVRGSKHSERKYSEYWTLIRSASRKGAPVATAVCSNCGAPLTITMAGACEHCGAHLTAGEFDWVLSKIEQDDTYRG